MRIITVLAQGLVLLVTSVAHSQSPQELNTIQRRYVASLLPADVLQQQRLHKKAHEVESTLSPEGTWPNVDYNNPERSDWPASHHLQNALILAKSARLLHDTGKPDTELEGHALTALRYWIAKDPRNPNWWWNIIGTPLLVVEISTLLRPILTDEDRTRIRPILERAVWTKFTGANLSWGVTIQILRGTLFDDPVAVKAGYNRLYEEVHRVPVGSDGIQVDNSFHQHGDQLYSGGYGLDFADDVGRFIAFAWNTSLAIPPSRMDTFAAFLLDGERWMIRGGVFDYSATGREITRVGKSVASDDWTGGPIAPFGAAYSLPNMVAMLAAEPTPRQPELRSFAEELKLSSNVSALEGNRHFWTSDYMVHRRKQYLTSVKMFSARTLNSEIVNGEGLKSAHLSDGLNFIYRRGDEYRDIFPIWDWTLLPGTTALHGNLLNGRPRTDEVVSIGQRGTRSFVGGVSDGRYGVAAMDLKRGPLTAHKAWFFFDNLYVALGAGITLAPGESSTEVATDINQVRARGYVFVNGKKLSSNQDARIYRNGLLHFVTQDGIGYIPGANASVTLSDSIKTGRWSGIGTGSSDLVSVPVFNLWISHGSSPRNATYQYTVLPDATEAQTMAEYRHPSVQVLSNVANIQAVYVAALKYVTIAFYSASALETPLGTVSVDHPAIVLIHPEGEGLSVTASNPENRPWTLHVTVNGTVCTIDLPGGDQAGSSITQFVPVR